MRSVYTDYSGLPARAMRSRCERLNLGVRFALALTILHYALISAAGTARAENRSSSGHAQTVRDVKRLIGQLDADTRSERAKARDALLALGPAILPLLPDDAAVSSAAARQALHGIRLRLQHESALASLRPSRVRRSKERFHSGRSWSKSQRKPAIRWTQVPLMTGC